MNRLNPFACASSIFGGMASSYFDVTTSTSAGPSCANAVRSACSTFSECSTRTLKMPAPFAIAAKSVALKSTLVSRYPAAFSSIDTKPSRLLL